MKDFRELGLESFILNSIRNYLQDLKIPLRTVTYQAIDKLKIFMKLME